MYEQKICMNILNTFIEQHPSSLVFFYVYNLNMNILKNITKRNLRMVHLGLGPIVRIRVVRHY